MSDDAHILIGYILKGDLVGRPPLPAHVREVCSVSGCVRGNPQGSPLELHLRNGAFLFNSAADAAGTRPSGSNERCEVFAYRIVPTLFTRGTGSRRFDWLKVFGCERAAFTVTPDAQFRPIGFDVVSVRCYVPGTAQYSPCWTSLDHSPLSCNGLADEVAVNERCLIENLADAIAAAERFSMGQPEPGPYVVIEVLR